MSPGHLPKGLSANNIIVTPTRGPNRAKNRKRNASPSPTPKMRPTTRADIEGIKSVDYDMKHHPMDDTMRPKASAKRTALKSTTRSTIDKASVKGSVSGGSKKTTTSRSIGRKIPAKQDLSTLLDKPLADTWSDLTPFDRRIYHLQTGALTSAKTLPFKWPQLANQLDQEGLLTKAQLTACGGVEALVERYELVRLHVQKIFSAADEPTDRADFKVLYAEGFDVYDLVGSKAEYVHARDRDVAVKHTAKKAKVDHTEGAEADAQMDSGIAEGIEGPVTPTAERTLPRSESEESEEIPWEEQVWGPGGIPPEHLHDNIESLEGTREDVSALIDDLMMSQDNTDKLYDDHMTQAHPTDIILSARAGSTPTDEPGRSIAQQEFASAASVGPCSSQLEIPVANMTADFRLGSLKPGSVDGLIRSANDHDGTETSTPSSSPVDREKERERQKKIHTFANVLSNGALSLMPATPKELTLFATAITPFTGPVVSGQLLEDLRAHGSDGSASTDHTQSAAQDTAARSAEASFQVFEDQAGNTLLVKEKVALHPLSPGTDVPNENFENDSDVDEEDETLSVLGNFHARTHNNQRHQPGLTASPSAIGHT